MAHALLTGPRAQMSAHNSDIGMGTEDGTLGAGSKACLRALQMSKSERTQTPTRSLSGQLALRRQRPREPFDGDSTGHQFWLSAQDWELLSGQRARWLVFVRFSGFPTISSPIVRVMGSSKSVEKPCSLLAESTSTFFARADLAENFEGEQSLADIGGRSGTPRGFAAEICSMLSGSRNLASASHPFSELADSLGAMVGEGMTLLTSRSLFPEFAVRFTDASPAALLMGF